MQAQKRHRYLKRLPPEYYRGPATVHWSLSIDERKTGWLRPLFHANFREILTHTMLRYGICCPVYCLMPDHIHLLWMGLLAKTNQLAGMTFFRQQMNRLLAPFDVVLQKQAYDHVLTDDERESDALEEVAEYIIRNPERAGIVDRDCYAEYECTGCLLPGYPKLSPFESEFWRKFWDIYSYLIQNGITRQYELT